MYFETKFCSPTCVCVRVTNDLLYGSISYCARTIDVPNRKCVYEEKAIQTGTRLVYATLKISDSLRTVAFERRLGRFQNYDVFSAIASNAFGGFRLVPNRSKKVFTGLQ